MVGVIAFDQILFATFDRALQSDMRIDEVFAADGHIEIVVVGPTKRDCGHI